MGPGTLSPVGRIQSQDEALHSIPERKAGLCRCLLVNQTGTEVIVMFPGLVHKDTYRIACYLPSTVNGSRQRTLSQCYPRAFCDVRSRPCLCCPLTLSSHTVEHLTSSESK